MNPPTPARQKGVTLIELMIVVAIIGIIAAVGYPSYRNYTLDAKRSDAYTALTRLASQQERYYADNNEYATKATELGYASDTPDSNEGNWSLSVAAPNKETAFTVTATAGGAKSHKDDDCKTLTLASTGLKSGKDKDDNANADCW